VFLSDKVVMMTRFARPHQGRSSISICRVRAAVPNCCSIPVTKNMSSISSECSTTTARRDTAMILVVSWPGFSCTSDAVCSPASACSQSGRPRPLALNNDSFPTALEAIRAVPRFWVTRTP